MIKPENKEKTDVMERLGLGGKYFLNEKLKREHLQNLERVK